MAKTVVLGMSGGIDSSMAAYILTKDRYRVFGVTFLLHDQQDQKKLQQLEDFAKKIGVKHEVIDLREEFKKRVIEYVVNSYFKGETPNPCAVCNKSVKFRYLIEELNKIGANFVATGHYVRLMKRESEILLQMGRDRAKSQEYFLARVEKEQLEKALFPLGNWKKRNIRKYAQALGFDLFGEESQEMCFIPEGVKYYEYILQNYPGDYSGKIIDLDGKVVGEHDCYFKFTIGQRQGLGVSGKHPYYVIKIDAENRDIIVGDKKDTKKDEFYVRDVYWYREMPFDTMKFLVKIRYNHPGEMAVVRQLVGNRCLVKFEKPQRAITPGQLAVFYMGEFVIGSGWIE